MDIIVNSLAQFLPYVFMIAVVGIIWDMVISPFMGKTR